MSGKLKRWLRTGVMLALLSIACPVHAFYNPSAGRWLSRDPIAETGGVNSLGFVKNSPISKVDILGLKFDVQQKAMPVGSFPNLPGGAQEFGETKVIVTHNGKDNVTENGCGCARVEQAAEYNVVGHSWVPDTSGIGVLFSKAGMDAIWGHEERRVQADLKGYTTYIEPANAAVTKCGTICRFSHGAAKAALEKYVTDLRSESLSMFSVYHGLAQNKIDQENSVWTYDGNHLITGLAWIAPPIATVPFNQPSCPTGDY